MPFLGVLRSAENHEKRTSLNPMKYEKYPEDHKAFYESYHDKKMTKKDYEWAVKEDKWLDEVLDGINKGMNTNWHEEPKKRTLYWELRTHPDEMRKYGTGTYWRFTPLYFGDANFFREMKVTKISVSAAGLAGEMKEDHEMDLGKMTSEVTRGMWKELVASGEYIVYNKQIKAKPLQWNKGSNYALEA
jgi:hypothetical protein